VGEGGGEEEGGAHGARRKLFALPEWR
jgi:hypothetical protein